MTRRPLPERLLPWVVLAVGVAIAFGFPSVNASPGESGQAAISLLEKGYIGDPYMVPTGPTAHVSPTLALLLAAVFRMFGENSTTARIVLGVIAAILSALGVRAVLRISALAALGRGAWWMTCGLLLLTPMFLFQAIVDDRQWDQPFAAFILVQGWLVFEAARLSMDRYRPETVLACLAGIGTLFSPSIGPTLAVALAAMIWRRRMLGNPMLKTLLCAGIMAACLVPWGVRNELVLGRFIVTRSNPALELDAGNGPGANGVSGVGTEAALHPHDSMSSAKEMQSIGEIAYMRKMQTRAIDWITTHPADFVQLTLRRMRLAFVPSREMVPWTPRLPEVVAWMLLVAFGLAKLASLAAAVLVRERPLTAVGFCVLPLAPYFITHVSLRYEAVTYFTSLALIVLVMQRIAATWNTRTPAAVARIRSRVSG